MRKEDFFDSITTYDELCIIANNAGYESLIEDIYDDNQYSGLISDRIYDMSTGCEWEEIKDFLNDIPCDYEYYLDCGWDEYIGLENGDDTFCEKINDLFDYMCENNLFDDEEDDDSDEFLEEETGTDSHEEVESLSEEEKLFIESVNDKTEEDVFGLFTDCSKYYQTI